MRAVRKNGSQTVDKVLSPLCGGRAFLVAKNKNGNQKTRYEIPIIQYMYGIKSMRQTIKEINQIFTQFEFRDSGRIELGRKALNNLNDIKTDFERKV